MAQSAPVARLNFHRYGGSTCSGQAAQTGPEYSICKVFADNAVALDLTEKQQERWHKKCICLVSFTDVKELQPALAFEKQSNMDDWLIVEKVEDVLVGISIRYNYENSKL